MNKWLRRVGWMILPVLAMAVCGGCGAGQYVERLKVGAQERRGGSETSRLLYDLSELQGTRVALRVPKAFAQSFQEGSVVAGIPVDVRRVKPTVATLPGQKLAYEALAPTNDGKVAYYCYLGVIEGAGKGVADPSVSLFGDLSEKLPEGVEDWKEVQCQTPEGRAMTWKKIGAKGPQEFYCLNKGGVPIFRKLAGTIEIYMYQAPSCYVFIGWRVPNGIEQSFDLERIGPLVAGSVVVSDK